MTKLIGAHVSTSGGWGKAVERACGMGCNYLQMFTGSPRIWKAREAELFDYEVFFRAREKYGLVGAVIHATYLVNLASDNPALVEKSVAALVNDLKVCALGKFDGVVVHLGSHQGRGYEAMRKQLISEISRIVDQTPEGGVFLIENSAGQNGKIGSQLEEVKDLIDGVGSERVGWCVDTCHLHAAGYVLGKADNSKLKVEGNKGKVNGGQRELFGEMKVVGKAVLVLATAEIERLDLWSRLKCIHINESKDGFGSGRDRHENLGEGVIGLEGLKEFLRNQALEVPLVLEVPGFDGKGPDAKNVSILKSLVE